MGEAPADAKPSRAAKKDKMEDGALPSTPTLEALCQRLSSFLCEELGGGGAASRNRHSQARRLGSRGGGKGGSRRRGARAPPPPQPPLETSPALLRSARLLLGGSWAAEAHAAGVPRALLEFGRARPSMIDPAGRCCAPSSRSSCHSRALPSKVFAMAMVTMAMVVVAMVLAVTAPPLATTRLVTTSSTFELRARFLKSLPRLLWQLQDTQPRSPSISSAPWSP